MHTTRFLRVGLIFALVCVVTLVYWPSATVYAAQWADFVNITFTHGWLIVAVCLALIVRERNEIATAELRPWPSAQLALAACACVWLVCYRANNQDLHITVFPALVWLAIAATFGRRVATLLAFPVAFFCFAVPSWAELSAPLQSLTVLAVQGLLRITGPQAAIAGDLIHIPNGTFRIEEGCSGLHFLIVGLAIAALHGELRRDPWRVRAAQLVLMMWLALLANWVRVYTIIERGYFSNMQTYLVRVSHYWFGWGVFAVALVLFLWLTEHFGPKARPRASETVVPVRNSDDTWRNLAVTIAILLGLPALSTILRAINPPSPVSVYVSPQPAGGWSPIAVDPHSTWKPQFVRPDREQRSAFADVAGAVVEVYSVIYRTQDQEAKLYGAHSSVLGPDLRAHFQDVFDAPGTGTFRETGVSDRTGGHWLIWSRYEVGRHHFVGPLASQLWYGLEATVSNPPARLVAVRAACASDCTTAQAAFESFLREGGTSGF